jgi:transcriptional regulator with XRE-family HTH domain
VKKKSESEIRRRLALRIRALRKIRGFTQSVLAEKSGLPRGYVGDMEGARRNPSLRNLLRVANALGVDLVDLFSDNDPV